MPTILRVNYENLIYRNIEKIIKKYNINGFIISNISNIRLLEDSFNEVSLHGNFLNLKLIANYTLNVFNNYTVNELKNLGVSKFTISPESNKEIINSLVSNSCLPNELIVYGNTPLMNINYCLSGKTSLYDAVP